MQRHLSKRKHFGRFTDHYLQMQKNLMISLILNKRIVTTLNKAKELRKFIEPLIELAKHNTLHSKRLVISRLCNNKTACKVLFDEIVPLVSNLNGGYIRIIKCGYRSGDKASLAIVFFKNLEIKQ